jgi:hypothetical protein
LKLLRGSIHQSAQRGGAEFGGNILTTLRVSGSGKAENCVSGINDGTEGASQHCDAVKAILETKDSPHALPVATDDKLITLSRSVMKNPEEIAGKIESAYSACETKTRTIGSDFELQTCDEWTSSVGARCSVALSVTNDPLYRYECTETLSTIESEVCTIGQQVAVDRFHNYQCAQKKNVQHIDCSKTAIVTVEYGETPGPQSFNLGGQVMPYYKLMTSMYRVFIDSTTLHVNPVTKSGLLTVKYWKWFCGDRIVIFIYDPNNVQVWSHVITNCGTKKYAYEYITFPVTMNGTYRIHEYVQPQASDSRPASVDLYATVNVEAPPPVVHVDWDDQCAHLADLAR